MIHLRCPKKCGPSRSLFDQYTAPGVQLSYQLSVGKCSGPGIWRAKASSDQSNTDAPYLMAVMDKSYTTPHPCLLPLEGNGWMLAGDKYIPVPCLYKPAPIAVLELIKCGCKTSYKAYCSCKKNNLPCTALCKCHNSDYSNLPDYRMIADDV